MATPLSNSDTAAFTVAVDDERERVTSVLLVAGDRGALGACARQLEAAGIRTAIAGTGFEAIVKACWHVPDVIVMQRGLMAGEGVDGSVAAQMLRLCPATAHIPVVDADTIDRLQAEASSRDFGLLARIARELSPA